MMGMPHCWAHLACISGGEILYLGSSILIVNFPAFTAAIWGWDWMDADNVFWMTFPF